MLSIGKLSAGQARYYLDQAEDRVDVVQSVGGGIEDYYFGPNKARGEWIGVAACQLGLEGSVAPEELRRVLAGLDPRDGRSLRSSTSVARVAGFDLTFSAPKSVSVLFGIGDDELRGRVRMAHDLAVRDGIGYLERSAAAVRRGHGGAVVEQASGLVAAAFRHRTSRAGDPQLHTHVLVANLGRGIDGRWSALDGRRLYGHARSASFVYQAVLRGELSRLVGVEWTPVRCGIGEVIGVPQSVMRAFSRRRAEIDAALSERGTTGPRAAEAAALATRQAKDPHAVADLVSDWRRRARSLGVGSAELSVVLGRVRPSELSARRWQTAWDTLAGPLGLTSKAATFARADVIQALCEVLPAGAQIDARTLEDAAERFLAERAVALVPDAEARAVGEAFRRRDGRLMPAGADRLRYSTPEHLALERRFVATAVAATTAGVGVVSDADVDLALAARAALSREQQAVVRSLCRDGHGVAVVAGKPGAGKTFALGAAREAWQAAGYPVLGVALARRAAGELQAGAGIPSTSVAALIADLRRGAEGLPVGCVLVVDEAGMVATGQLAELLDHVRAARGKLVLVGDHRQLPELGAGGAFRGLVHRGLAVELGENVRQNEPWEREALDHLRAGRAETALALYAAHEALVVEPDEDAVRDKLVADWAATSEDGDCVMIAQRRADVADLNLRARVRLANAGRIRGAPLDLPGGEFAFGDRVVVKRNDRRLGVHNGQRGRIVGIDDRAGSLTLECRKGVLTLDHEFLLDTTLDGEPTLLHGYAITGHVAQGLTVDRSFVLASEGVRREWAYVALSRGRLSNRLYTAAVEDHARVEFAPADRDRREPVERLVAALRASSAQVLAIDTGAELEAAERAAERAARERYQLESRRGPWLPHRRRALERARERELAVATNAGRLRAELRHAARPFETEAELAAARDLSADRATQRILDRARSPGREL